MYVITVARTGPISPISAANRMNAAAVQIVPRTTTDTMTLVDSGAAGHWSTATGAYSRAEPASESAMIPSDGTPPRRRARIAGPIA